MEGGVAEIRKQCWLQNWE